jgi:site-specific recombinase XerD
MSASLALGARGRQRSPATTPDARPGTEEGVIQRTRHGSRRSSRSCARPAAAAHGARARGLIVVLWRAGLPISEAHGLAECDLDPGRGAIVVRRGKGGKRREIGMDEWEQLRPGLQHRASLPIGALFCVISGPTRGRPWSDPAARTQLRRLAARAAVRRRFAPHQLRHAHAVEMAREGVPLNVIQRQPGHADLGVTSIYLQGIDNTEVISAVHGRRAPTMPASAGLLM